MCPSNINNNKARHSREVLRQLISSEFVLHSYTMYYIFRLKNQEIIPRKKTKKRPTRQGASRRIEEVKNLKFAYWNLNGFDIQSAWAIERIIQREVNCRANIKIDTIIKFRPLTVLIHKISVLHPFLPKL